VPLEAGRLGRLTRDEEFRQVYRRGVRRSSTLLVVHALPNSTNIVRVGLAVRRSLGPAVVRNRIRRRIREAVRAERYAIRGGVDLVVSPREAAVDAPFRALRREVRAALEACGIVTAQGETTGWSHEDCCC
jgi:ribonuclease P protein component